tara:strand:- start:776 stop:973 length:198 start_codon:yes stop_codon:yes gene_type:complete
MEDEVLVKQSIIDELKKEYIDELSITELQDRILSLKEEIDRAKDKIEFKKQSKSKAESIFKKKVN